MRIAPEEFQLTPMRGSGAGMAGPPRKRSTWRLVRRFWLSGPHVSRSSSVSAEATAHIAGGISLAGTLPGSIVSSFGRWQSGDKVVCILTAGVRRCLHRARGG